MTEMQKTTIALIKAAITGEKVEIPKYFSLEDVVKTAKKHNISTMIYYGALLCGIESDNHLINDLFIDTCKNIAVSEYQMYSFKEICKAFDEEKIEYMPLKGTVLKSMYPKPEMRIMGDADILIKTEQYEKIKPIMESLGFSNVTESDHEFIWRKSHSLIELHKRIIPSYNKDYYAYFEDGWKVAKIKDGTKYAMTDEDNMIYLFTHFAKHYRDSGIGVKHIVDLWVYRNCHNNMNEEYIEQELKKLQLCDFYTNIVRTLSVWFEGAVSDKVTDFITNVIFNSGVFGTKEAQILSNAVKLSKTHKTAKKVRNKKFFNLVFLPYKSMCIVFPFLKKAPYLLPFMWIFRGFRTLIFRRKKIRTFKQGLVKITDNKMQSYQMSLEFVGLDFNFKE